MSDDQQKKPDPVDDLKKGFGLLFRAAKTAMDQLPRAGKLEKAVVSGVKEVGRAIENVTDQIDRQVFGGKGTIPHPEDPKRAEPPPAPADETKKDEEKKDEPIDPDEEPPRGPRVA
jgi:hypothetical protein